MDDFLFTIMTEYLSFKNILKEKIEKYSTKITSGNCYLVDESLINNLKKIDNEYIPSSNPTILNNNNKKILNFKNNFDTINGFSTLMSCLTYNKKFEFVSPEFVQY